MNRALRAAAISALLLTPVALSACSAGQVAQTAEQNRDKVGGQADAGDIAVRRAHLAYPLSGAYSAGGDARLIVAIANDGPTDDTLLDITGDAFDGAEVTGTTLTSSTTGSDLGITVPATSNVYVGDGGPQVTLTGLAEDLTPGQSIEATLSFEEAGDVPVTVLVGVATRDLPRGEAFDFEHGDGAGSGSGE